MGIGNGALPRPDQDGTTACEGLGLPERLAIDDDTLHDVVHLEEPKSLPTLRPVEQARISA